MPFNPKSDRHSVFLNVPFDADYEPLFVALIVALIALGRKPRCVLELPEQGQGRHSRLIKLIGLCPVSIHDLSRVEEPARFNMPFELGLAVGLARVRKSGKFVLLETKRYRLQKTLSDLNGFDPGIHGGKAHGIISCVLSHLGKPSANPAPEHAMRVYRRLWESIPIFKHNYRRRSIFFRPIFAELLVAASEMAKAEGLLRV
jgi:hypothetical protein